jgi:hypothetical protein
VRCILAIATFAAVAALIFGTLATRATSGQASLLGPDPDPDRGGVSGALSYRARLVTPDRGHWRALQTTFERAHRRSDVTPRTPQRLLEATHQGVLWALATFTLDDGTVVVERFSWRRGVGWRDLGATRARCPSVPPEVRSVWRLTACQTG